MNDPVTLTDGIRFVENINVGREVHGVTPDGQKMTGFVDDVFRANGAIHAFTVIWRPDPLRAPYQHGTIVNTVHRVREIAFAPKDAEPCPQG